MFAIDRESGLLQMVHPLTRSQQVIVPSQYLLISSNSSRSHVHRLTPAEVGTNEEILRTIICFKHYLDHGATGEVKYQ